MQESQNRMSGSIIPVILAFIAAFLFTVVIRPGDVFYYVLGAVVVIAIFFVATQDQRQFRIKEIWWSVLVCMLLGSLLGRLVP